MNYQSIPSAPQLASQGKIAVPVPALVVVLDLRTVEKGSSLTRDEVEEARDNCECLILPAMAAKIFQSTRGHADIRPEHVWDDWQAVQASRQVSQ